MFLHQRNRLARFRPSIEALEERWVPATVGPVVTSPGVLTITAKSSGSTIVVNDTGAGFGNNITVNFDSNKPAVFASINTINIVGSNSKDKVQYTITSAFGAANRTVNCNLFDGNDIINFDAVNINISQGAAFNFSVAAGAGTNTLDFSYGGVIGGALNLTASSDTKPSFLCAQFGVRTGSTGTLNATLNGGTGKDYLTLAACQDNSGDPVVINAVINAHGSGGSKDVVAITPGVTVNSVSGEKFTPKLLGCSSPVCSDQ